MVYHTFLGKFQPTFSISGPGDGFKKRYAFLISYIRDPNASVAQFQLRSRVTQVSASPPARHSRLAVACQTAPAARQPLERWQPK